MKSFHFPLDRVLEWRRTEANLEKARFAERRKDFTAAMKAKAEWEALVLHTEQQMSRAPEVRADELHTLARFLAAAKPRAEQLAARMHECETALAEQRGRLEEARRRTHLLEKLRERRLAEWRAACDLELEALAAETYLAQSRA